MIGKRAAAQVYRLLKTGLFVGAGGVITTDRGCMVELPSAAVSAGTEIVRKTGSSELVTAG